jgi:hypothetical protein
MRIYPDFRDLERVSGISWNDLLALEPRLAELLCSARQACSAPRRWSDMDQVFSPIRNALTQLIGFTGTNHEHPILGSSWAYQVAYWKLYDGVAALLRCHTGGAEEFSQSQRGERVGETCPPKSAATANRRRFNRTFGFWLGGALLGVGGCILGAWMAHPDPVVVTFSVLWWGIYLGCFGASIGALLGLWAEQTGAPPSQGARKNHEEVAEAAAPPFESDNGRAAA